MDSDRELIRRIVAGDSAAFEALLDRHGETVRRHLARMVRDEVAAADLTQEVFLRVWTRADQQNASGALAAWLLLKHAAKPAWPNRMCMRVTLTT